MNHEKIYKKKNLYNFAFSILGFLAILASYFLIYFLEKNFIIGFFEIFLISLATFRITRLFVYDAIFAFFRDFFLDVKVLESGKVERKKYDFGIKRSISDILSCPWCFSFWAAFLMYFFYVLFSEISFYVLIILSISAIASLLQIFANLIGWSAEYRKIKTQNKEKKYKEEK